MFTEKWNCVALSAACIQIRSPLPEDKVDWGIGLSYRPASLCSLKGRYIKQPFAIVNIIPPVRDSELGIWTLQCRYSKFLKWFFVSSSHTYNWSLTLLYSTVHNWSICTFIGKTHIYCWFIALFIICFFVFIVQLFTADTQLKTVL